MPRRPESIATLAMDSGIDPEIARAMQRGRRELDPLLRERQRKAQHEIMSETIDDIIERETGTRTRQQPKFEPTRHNIARF